METIPNLDAGQSLLASLNRRRGRLQETGKAKGTRTSKSLKDQVKFVPQHAIPVEDFVLYNPAAEVHSLPEHLLGKQQTQKLAGVKRLVSSKEDRHNNAQALFEEKRRNQDQRHKHNVQDEVSLFEKKLGVNTIHIENLFVNLEEDKIISMEEDMFREIGEEIMLQFSVRQGWIDDLGSRLKTLESDRRKTIESLLLRTLGELVEIAHLSEGSLQRFLEKNSLETNANILENSKLYADFQKRLRTAEIIKERKCKEDLDKGLEKWRQLRTQHAIECFKERVKSDEVYNPPKRAELFVMITDKQAKTYKALELNFASVSDMLPPTTPVEQSVRDWKESTFANIAKWEGQTDRIVERLWYEENRVKDQVSHELASLEEDILSYGALSEEEMKVAIDENCMSIVRERELFAAGLITKCDECLKGQYESWRKTCTILEDFLVSVIGSQEKQMAKLKEMEDNVRSAMQKCRSDFTDANTKREDDLENCRNEIYQSNTDVDLEKKVTMALEKLDGIEEGYRGFHKDMLHIVHNYPVDVSDTNALHWNSMCKILYIKTEENETTIPEKEEGEGENENEEGKEEAAPELEEDKEEDGENSGKPAQEQLPPLVVHDKSYDLAADIYDKLFTAPEPVEAEEEETEEDHANGKPAEEPEENAEGEGEEGQKSPKKEEVALEIPDPITEVVVQDQLIKEILEYTQKEILHHIDVSTNDHMILISSWSTKQEEHLTDELDSRLRSHRPRAGRVEEEDREFRSVELAGQRRRFDRHLRRAVHALKMNKQNYENELMNFEARFNDLVNKIKSAENHLHASASVKGLDIRIRETQKLKTKLVSKVKAEFESLKTIVGNNCQSFLALNAKFCDDNFKNETSSASYGVQTIQESTSQLESLDKEAHADLEAQMAHFAEKEEKCVQLIEDAYVKFESMTEPHREDLGLLESVDTSLNQAKSTLRSEFSCSYSISKEVSDQIVSLDKLRPNVEPASDDTFNGLLSGACSGMYRLDVLLHFYCSYLQCLKSEFNSQQMLETLNSMEEERKLSATNPMTKTDFFKSETLKAAVDDLIGESKQSLNKTAETYYSSKKSIDEITRKNRIPNDVKTMKEQIENIVTDLNHQANEHLTSMLLDVRKQIILASRSLEKVPAKIMKEFVKGKTFNVKQKLGLVLSEFQGEYNVMKRDRNEHEKSLRPSLANPLLKNEFDLLCSEEEERSTECKKVLRTFATKMLEVTHEELMVINRELHNVAKMLALLLDNLVQIDDIEAQEPLEDRDRENFTAKHLISLQRYETFRNNSEASRSDVKGRPFKMRIWDEVNDFTLEEIGWNSNLTDLLGDTPEEGAEEKSFEMEKNSESLKSFETPQAFALIVARNRAMKDLKLNLTEIFKAVIGEIKGCIYEENEWQKKWPRMLEGLKDL